MRILFSSSGNYGHIYPLLALATAARDAGHEVRFATAEMFHPVLREAGLDAVTAGVSVPEAFLEAAGGAEAVAQQGGPTSAADLPPEVLHFLGLQAFGSVLPRRVVRDLGPVLAEWQPNLVVHEYQNPGAAFAAQLAGIPALCHGFGRMLSDADDAELIAVLKATADDLGVKLPDSQVLTVGNPYIDIAPGSFQDPELLGSQHPRIALRPVPYATPGELPAVVTEDGAPLVYVTLGTVMGHPALFGAVIAALAELDVRVLVATGPSVEVAALGEVPANVVVQPWVPQVPQVLARAAAVVHHGGSGTTLSALAAGVPQLVLPIGSDQFHNADAVAAAGVGDRLLGHEISPQAIADRMKALLSENSYQAAASRVADEIAAMPAPGDVVAQFASYAR
jgi:UDP:flavonoid glycosyltransferase YjiC (YdhE family)